MEVESWSEKEWSKYAERAHLVVFSKLRPAGMDRIDFALVVKDGSKLMGYVTCREWDSESLYWQFGGAFPGTRETSLSFRGYQAFVRWTKDHYKRVSTLISNDNAVMLKMAAKVGFKIIGVRTFRNTILLEHLMEF